MRYLRLHKRAFRKAGFTLMELLIVIAIIIILLVLVLINIRGELNHANDAKRKSDVYSLHNAMEEYNNDHSFFPAAGVLATCGGPQLAPYLKQIPCDPTTRQPYGYFPSNSTGGYRICTILQDKTDPSIQSIGCGGASGCGLGGGYNWCLSSGTSPSAVGTADETGAGTGSGGGAPTPTPNLSAGNWACAPPDFLGISYCNNYSNPGGAGCPLTFADNTCGNECGNPAIRCAQ